MSVGFVAHPSSLVHDAGRDHPERPARITAIHYELKADGLLDELVHHSPEPASWDSVGLVHDPVHIELLQTLDRQGGGRVDVDTRMGPGSLDATLRATQGAIDAIGNVMSGAWSSGFVCMRPPGHHARPRVPMGFCLTNHVAIGAAWALSNGAERIVILDWDAHHGNGTQEIFWSDPRVLYVSLHQYPWYPGTGDVTERGEDDGYGATVNIPMPAGTAEEIYQQAMDEVIEPAVGAFAPDLVLISAGYDAHRNDPLCMMRLGAGAFFRFTRQVATWGRGPVAILEGGYDLDALAWGTAATVAALIGADEPPIPAHER